MSTKRAGFRIIAYCSLLIIYSTFIVDRAVNIRRGISFSSSSHHLDTYVFAETHIQDHFVESHPQPQSVRVEGIKPNDQALSANNTKRTHHDFIPQFEEIFSNPDAYDSFSALIVKNGGVYCRKGQLSKLSRARYYVQMLQKGLQQLRNNNINISDVIPVLIKHDDSNGCYPAEKHDKYAFPRLAWSIPFDNNDNWCQVAGMPSYKAWRDAGKKIDGDKYWHHIFKTNDKEYPWHNKLNMAVWRGATTFNKGLYGRLDVDDIPRAKLVMKAKESVLIDAAFHKLVGKYDDEGEISSHVRRFVSNSIPLNQMMKYKAIIDIDGNNWSARFNSLLCSNSVIIKIQPDFIEESHLELKPFVHYIPATVDNITQSVEYVMDIKNEREMKQIVMHANEWCQVSMTATALSSAAVAALQSYMDILSRYDTSWREKLTNSMSATNAHDLVPCYNT